MTIARITKTKQGRYALFDDADVFLFSIDAETLVRRCVCEDMELDADALADLRGESDARKATEKALTYLGMRDHSGKELYDKLCVKFDAHTSAAAVAEVTRMGLVDDAAFAAHRAASLARQKKSTREIQRQLLQKGVSRDIVAEVLDDLQPEDEDACYALIQKMYLRKLEAGETQKVMAALARRGFSYGDSKRAIARCGADAPDEAYDEA